MVNASRGYAGFFMMNKSLRAGGRESRRAVNNEKIWFPAGCRTRRKDIGAKKSRRFRRLLKVDNREASNRVDRSHSVSKQGQRQS
jgi:hypothetical protein